MRQNHYTYMKPLSMSGLGGGATSLSRASSGGAIITLPAIYYAGQNQQQEITVSNFISAGQTLLIPTNLYVWSDDVNTAALTIDISCTIINQGIIMGRGGNGGSAQHSNNTAGQDGGTGIKINSGVSGVTITNAGGFIYGGGGGGGTGENSTLGGGGGGGAGGGKGGRGAIETTQTAGGLPSYSGSSSSKSLGGVGGDNGGSGASSNANNTSTDGGSGGGGGRKIAGGGVVANQAFAPNSSGSYFLRGTGGTGMNYGQTGGSGYSPISSAFNGFIVCGGGGGGYGASGGTGSTGSTNTSGGSGGKAIDDSGQSYTLSNSGVIYGGT